MNDLQQQRVEGTSNIQHPTSNAERSWAATLAWIKHFFDYLGGSREEPPPGASFLSSPILLGIWWGVLIGFILLFCGQTSKFIYIDF
jgi:hypothetical protein